VRPRVGPALLERRLQSVGWSPEFFSSFSFFWPNSGRPADAAAAGACLRGGRGSRLSLCVVDNQPVGNPKRKV
jgi:hypothetical protein